MDLPQLTLSIAQAVSQRVVEVRANADACKETADFVEESAPVVAHLSSRCPTDTGIAHGLRAAVDALELARAAVDKCCQATVLRSVFRSREIGDGLKKATSSLSRSLALLSAANVGISEETLVEILNLKEHLTDVHFDLSAAAQHEAGEVKQRLEIGFNTIANATVQMKKLFEDHCKMHEQQQVEMWLLKDFLFGPKRSGERFEDSTPRQIRGVAETGALVPRKHSATTLVACQGHTPRVVCPTNGGGVSHAKLEEGPIVPDGCFRLPKWLRRERKKGPKTSFPESAKSMHNFDLKHPWRLLKKSKHNFSRNRLAEDSMIHPDAALKPGLLEGKRRTNKGDNVDGVVHILLLLDISGNVLGFQELTSDASASLNRVEILGGNWDQGSIRFLCATHKAELTLAEGSLLGQSSVCSSSLCLKLKERLALRVLKAQTQQEMQHFIDINAVKFDCIVQPPPLNQYVLGCGLIQMDGLIRGQSGEEYSNRLLLLLQGNGAVKGWMYSEDRNSSPKTFGMIREGGWDGAVSTLQFSLDVFVGNPHDCSSKIPSMFVRFDGEISSLFQTASATSPSFIGRCHMLESGSSGGRRTMTNLCRALEKSATFEYRNFVAPSVQPSPFHTNTMTLMHPVKELGNLSQYNTAFCSSEYM